jgi:hypothetical protein
MFSHNAFTRRAFTVFAASGALTIASCGGDTDFGLGQLHPFTGTVTYNGKPLEKGQINFYPADPSGVGSMGIIESGTYAMGTLGEKNGARAGKYKVGITSKEDSEAQAKAEFEKAKGKTTNVSSELAGSGRVPREFMVKATKEAKNLIPAGYGDLRTTTLTAEVKEGSNSLDFKLTDADAPPEPPKDAPGKARRK